MSVIKDYWQHIATKLTKEHPEEKSPAGWTKSEAKPFLEKLQTKTSKSISATTFRRIFKEGHHGKLETRDIFAQYFDYPTYGDYIKSELNKKSINWKYIVVPIAALLLLFLLIQKTSFSEVSIKEENRSKIATSVKKAINHQFAAFQFIPNYEHHLDTLQRYYSADGAAYKDIFAILKRQSGLNWTIKNPLNASMAELLNLRVDSISGDKAYISTTEHWRLDWFSQTSQRYEYHYEATNDQTYILEFDKTLQHWKVLQNSFRGNKFRYIPKYISCKSIEDQITSLNSVKENVIIAIENDGLDLALKVLECYYSNNASIKFPSKLSLLLAEKTQLLREINTDTIDKTAFEVKKVALFKDILRFLEG